MFATRIAYVVQTSRTSWELHIADADGANPQAALRSREPIISPAWSPDGGRLAYVSFETGKPVVYVHTVATGERKAVANFRGSNSAPAWSPDGRTLAVTLTREGNSQVFLMNADGSNVRRLTQTTGIDTEPVFSPDGQWIYFTSDRGGGPQIYKMPARAAMHSASPSTATTTSVRGCRPTASCWPTSVAAAGASRSCCSISPAGRKSRRPTRCATNHRALPPTAGCCFTRLR